MDLELQKIEKHFAEIENYPIQIAIENLKPYIGNLFPHVGTCAIWNNETRIYIDFDEAENKLELLKNYLPLLEKYLGWLSQHRKDIVQALINDEYLERANEWASSEKLAEDEEQECYIMSDRQKVFLPITEEDFSNSLRLEDIWFNCCEVKHEITLELCFTCSPDYFAYHALIVYISEDGSIESGGLSELMF
ncbi:MAG: DUF2262 domain-containing protein [Oscillospiraceae bacterium]|nr:DUF2262 domain-containing protein [Oscillospiraceae bacterium]